MKDLNKKTDQIRQTVKGGCAASSFYESCQKQMIIPQAIFAKIDSTFQRFVVSDFLINNEMAIALEAYFKNSQS